MMSSRYLASGLFTVIVAATMCTGATRCDGEAGAGTHAAGGVGDLGLCGGGEDGSPEPGEWGDAAAAVDADDASAVADGAGGGAGAGPDATSSVDVGAVEGGNRSLDAESTVPDERAHEADVRIEPPPAVGSPCDGATECPSGGSGAAVCLSERPGGYCAVDECAEHGHDCPEDAGNGGTVGVKCVKAPGLVCLRLCSTAGDCRDGYACVPKDDAAGHGQAKVCAPE